MPHSPYIFEPDCSINKNNNENKNIGYMKNYKCMLNRLMAFFEYINKYDPQANVIVTSDASLDFYNKDTENQIKIFSDKFHSFTLIKINKECKKYLNKNECTKYHADAHCHGLMSCFSLKRLDQPARLYCHEKKHNYKTDMQSVEKSFTDW